MAIGSPKLDGLRMVASEAAPVDTPLEVLEPEPATLGDGAVESPEGRAECLDTLIRSWTDEGDPEEQRDTLEHLVRTLDEDRLSDRKLFPEELKGKSW